MKCNVILEASRADAREGDISKWHGATLLNGGYNKMTSNLCYRKLCIAHYLNAGDGRSSKDLATARRSTVLDRVVDDCDSVTVHLHLFHTGKMSAQRDSLLNIREPACVSGSSASELSPRQLECLDRIARGETTGEISQALGLSRHTVDHYIGAACDKLGARSRAQAVAIAIVRRFIEPYSFK